MARDDLGRWVPGTSANPVQRRSEVSVKWLLVKLAFCNGRS